MKANFVLVVLAFALGVKAVPLSIDTPASLETCAGTLIHFTSGTAPFTVSAISPVDGSTLEVISPPDQEVHNILWLVDIAAAIGSTTAAQHGEMDNISAFLDCIEELVAVRVYRQGFSRFIDSPRGNRVAFAGQRLFYKELDRLAFVEDSRIFFDDFALVNSTRLEWRMLRFWAASH
ncbi:hypothetical protein M422DRAFT_247403 [Sphaerobolus stellatus SS14]|nr:hypothetical protein M422DRAFT_247403 [Sphaerobolus stellatus SS14]